MFVVLASLDNAAFGILPPLYAVIARDLSVDESSIGVVSALNILIIGFSAAIWGYWGDQTSRKRLLLYGTLIWGAATLVTGLSQDVVILASPYLQLLAAQMIGAVGLGCIESVGFSVVSDFVSPKRRGFAMSFWGLSQGIGLFGGTLLGGVVGAGDWRLPFFIVAGAGLAFAGLFLFTYDPERGRTEPELSKVHDSGEEYEYRIKLRDVVRLADTRSNVWLVLQGFTAQFAYGSLIWLPRLFVARVESAGFSVETATIVGALFAAMFRLGGLFSILGGFLGDLWQRRDPRGRAILSAIGVLGAIPLFLALFFLPLQGLDIPDGAGAGAVVLSVVGSVFTNGWVAGAFLLSLAALAMTSADSPNWFALISDVNMPERRGTVFGLANLSNSVGRAGGNWLTPVAAGFLETRFAAPLNFAVGLAVFQAFFLPTGLCYYKAAKTTPGDIADARRTLRRRAEGG